MKKSLLTYALFFCAFAVFSQTEIKGKITDASNMPIIGANVIIKGSTSGAVTDFDGNFSFNTSLTGEQTLIVSYIGFETFEEKMISRLTMVMVVIGTEEEEEKAAQKFMSWRPASRWRTPRSPFKSEVPPLLVLVKRARR